MSSTKLSSKERSQREVEAAVSFLRVDSWEHFGFYEAEDKEKRNKQHSTRHLSFARPVTVRVNTMTSPRANSGKNRSVEHASDSDTPKKHKDLNLN